MTSLASSQTGAVAKHYLNLKRLKSPLADREEIATMAATAPKFSSYANVCGERQYLAF